MSNILLNSSRPNIVNFGRGSRANMSRAITSTSGSAFDPYGNRPSGYNTVSSNYGFNTAIPVADDTAIADGSGWYANFNSSGYATITTDASAPISPSSVLNWDYHVGQGSPGSSAGFGNVLLTGLSTSITAWYISFNIWHDSSFEWNATSNKMLMIWTYNAGTSGVAILESRHFANAFLSWQFENYPGDTGYYTASTAFGNSLTNSYFEGNWVNIEVEMIFGASGTIRTWAGRSDGSDGPIGQLCLEYTGILVPAPEAGHEVGLHSTWGGGGGPTTRSSIRRCDNIFLAHP